jgi:hypothetical protein
MLYSLYQKALAKEQLVQELLPLFWCTEFTNQPTNLKIDDIMTQFWTSPISWSKQQILGRCTFLLDKIFFLFNVYGHRVYPLISIVWP